MSVLWPLGGMGARLDDGGSGRQSNLAPVRYLGIEVETPWRSPNRSMFDAPEAEPKRSADFATAMALAMRSIDFIGRSSLMASWTRSPRAQTLLLALIAKLSSWVRIEIQPRVAVIVP
jgi:hypothetical protein